MLKSGLALLLSGSAGVMLRFWEFSLFSGATPKVLCLSMLAASAGLFVAFYFKAVLRFSRGAGLRRLPVMGSRLQLAHVVRSH